MQNEIWKEIPGFEGYYELSTSGQVRSMDRKVPYKHGGKSRFWPSHLMRHYLGTTGYWAVDLKKSGVVRKSQVHRLVALTFLENPNKKREVNHIDGNKLNNNLYNLEWATPAENMQHSYRTGLHKGKGATHYNAKRIISIKTGAIYGTLQEAANALGKSKLHIWRILKGHYKNRFDIHYL